MMKDPYLYPNSDVLKNLAGVRDSEELKNVEADYTLLRLSEIAEDESPEIFNFNPFVNCITAFFRMYMIGQGSQGGSISKKRRQYLAIFLLCIQTVLILQKTQRGS